ncbi:BamA/TamA family outer membrane protein [Wenzhouxiangella sp. XN79A]|uniref:autotransporter assembly complex protein TamA n=1 Tax=Wenzhouxiangella sp. XN79A TaxID=2724193 RepID=UPI00144A8156|nr:BamA/TamA family outer membrane protein [Wenzhouxiangella sp. XN79A]NKI35221.1 BamA/TamA family outer membrane protein [Wenzhouxiangella sp. XN79A]
MSRSHRLVLLATAALGLAGPVHAATVTTEIRGLSDELQANVRASLSLVRAESLETVSVWRLRQWADAAEEEAELALQPFGYYTPSIAVRLKPPASSDNGAPWQAVVEIEPGEPVRIENARLAIEGPAGDLPAFRDWRENWPLTEGTVLHHPTWTQQLRRLDGLADAHGFFEARYVDRRIEVRPVRNEASIDLRYDGGPRYVIGDIAAENETFTEKLMRRLTVLEPGAPYASGDLDRQREVLVRSGYFESVIVETRRDAERDAVDVRLSTEPRPPNTYRIQAGFGTDTGVRAQLGWQRHYLGAGGDRLNMQLGAQQTDQEFVFRTDYQRPFGGQPGNFLTAGVRLQQERDRFRFEDEDRIEPVFDPFGGTRRQASLTFGRLRERLLFDDFSPLQEHLFVTVLREQFDAFSADSLSLEQSALLGVAPGLRRFLDTDTQTLAAGAEWTLFRLSGEGFAQQGQYARLRLLGASEGLGSDVSFAQGYATARWHWRFLPRHKLLLRGELGYTAADTTQFDLALPDDPRRLDLNITSLPDPFRFRTGGDRTVRGYAFEDLSTNRNGANHLVVGSAEYEFKLFGDVSVAAFYDIGNAFNDWESPELKAGTGVGVRWYTVIGPVQLDFARALANDDLRIHFTIGTKLL